MHANQGNVPRSTRPCAAHFRGPDARPYADEAGPDRWGLMSIYEIAALAKANGADIPGLEAALGRARRSTATAKQRPSLLRRVLKRWG
jgi:hypothetical protein